MPQTIFSKKELVEGPAPRRRQEVVHLPHSCWPAPPRQSARRVASIARRRQRQLQQSLPALGAPDGHGVHGPQLLRVAILKIEAPRRVRRCSESARVLHCLERRFVKSLLCWNLSDPELCGRLLSTSSRALHRLVGPRVVGRSGLPKAVAPLAALAGHARGQVLLQRLDSPVHHGRGVAVLRALCARLPQVQRGELIEKRAMLQTPKAGADLTPSGADERFHGLRVDLHPPDGPVMQTNPTNLSVLPLMAPSSKITHCSAWLQVRARENLRQGSLYLLSAILLLSI